MLNCCSATKRLPYINVYKQFRLCFIREQISGRRGLPYFARKGGHRFEISAGPPSLSFYSLKLVKLRKLVGQIVYIVMRIELLAAALLKQLERLFCRAVLIYALSKPINYI